MNADPSSDHSLPHYHPADQNNQQHQASSRSLSKLDITQVIIGSTTAILTLASLLMFSFVIPQITTITNSLGNLTTTVNSNSVDVARSRTDINEKFIGKIDSTKAELLVKMERIDSTTDKAFNKYLELDSNQHKLTTDLSGVKNQLDRVETNLGQEVTDVRGSYNVVAESLESVVTDVNEVGREMAEISGSVSATNIVANTIDNNKAKIENLELESSQTEGEVSILGVMQENGISSKETTRVVTKLFKDNEELRNTPSLLTTILSEKKQDSPIRFARNLKDTHALTISDEDALVLAYDVLQVPQEKSFYLEPRLGAAIDSTAGDIIPNTTGRLISKGNSVDKNSEQISSIGKISIIDACAELIQGDKTRDKCYLHFLERLSIQYPEIEKPKAGFTEEEIEKIRTEHSAIDY